MARKNKLITIFAILIIAALLYFFKGLFFVAIVNGQPVSRISLIQGIEKQFCKQALDAEITKILILEEARKKNISVSLEEAEGELKKIEENLTSQGQNLDQALALQGMTKDDLAKQIRIQKTVEKLLEKEITVADKEVNEYLEKNEASVPKDAKPEEVQSSAKEQLRQQKLSEKFNSWIEALKQNAKINYFVNF